MIDDVRAAEMRVLAERDVGFLNHERRKVNLKVEDHVVHPQRLGIFLDVQADRLFVDDDAAQHEPVIGHVVSANLVTTGVNPHVIGFWRKHLHLWHFVNANDAVRASRMQMRGSQFRPCSNDRSFVDARSPRGRVPHVGEASNPSP